MTTQEVIAVASAHLASLASHTFDVLTITKPVSPDAAVNLSRIISKLSPLLGNLIEFNTVEFLNSKDEFEGFGLWWRQDPGFPDTVFTGTVEPTPGFEIKAWFPLATEITARFKDSQKHFTNDNTYVALLAWLPEHLIYGKPCIVDVCVASGQSVAAARDNHYHNPPDYLVLEPEDTRARTRNLQQTNTNGLKFQGTRAEFEQAKKIVESWGPDGRAYKPAREYQQLLHALRGQFNYRLDTNYAKMDRIVHAGIEEFKRRVDATTVNGLTVAQWKRILAFKDDDEARQTAKEMRLREALASHLEIPQDGEIEIR
ncbi:MAG: hypothetical protein AAB403_12605 [Planctomycetota bacterium]